MPTTSSLSGFNALANQLGNSAVGSNGMAGSDAMSQIQQTAATQMKFQTEMGQIKMVTQMNEAVAKMFKSIGEAVKGLA